MVIVFVVKVVTMILPQVHWDEFVAIAPRTECLETPINDPKKTTHTREFSWGTHKWTDTEIKVDETRQT